MFFQPMWIWGWVKNKLAIDWGALIEVNVLQPNHAISLQEQGDAKRLLKNVCLQYKEPTRPSNVM
jgi:hypothetical protein